MTVGLVRSGGGRSRSRSGDGPGRSRSGKRSSSNVGGVAPEQPTRVHVIGMGLMLLGASLFHFPVQTNFVVYSEARTYAFALGGILLLFACYRDFLIAKGHFVEISKSEQNLVMTTSLVAVVGAVCTLSGGILGLKAVGLNANMRSLWMNMYAGLAWLACAAIGSMITDELPSAVHKKMKSVATTFNLIGRYVFFRPLSPDF